MSTIPPILIQLQADVTNLKQGLAQAQAGIKGMDDTVKKSSTGMDSMVGNLKKVGAAMGVAFAGAQAVAFAKSVVMASSDMGESLSKVNVVFGDMSDSVIKFSRQAASSMGISSQKALEATGTYGNLLQAVGLTREKSQEMSLTMVQLAGDLASFNNTPVDDALNALRSGLTGETEPLKRFGVALSDVTIRQEAMLMGFKLTPGIINPAIKSQVVYSLIMKQTALAQGDYLRTADGAANTMKTLAAKFEDAKVALGDVLMPAFKALLGLLSVLVPVLELIGKFFKDNAESLKILTVIVGLGTAAFLTYRGVIITTTTVTAIYTAVVKAQAAGFTLAQIAAFNFKVALILLNRAIRANPIGAIVTALTILAVAFMVAWKKSETFKAVIIKVIQGALKYVEIFISAWAGLFNLFGKIPGMGWAKTIGKGLDDLSTKIGSTSRQLSSMQEKFKIINANQSMVPSVTDIIGGKLKGSASAGKTSAEIAATIAEAKKAAEEAAKKAAADAKDKKEKLAGFAKDVKKIYKDMNETILEAKENAAEKLADRDERIAEANLRALEDTENLNKRFREQMADATERFDDSVADAKERSRKADLQANKRYDDTRIKIQKDYNDKLKDLEVAHTAKIADLRASAAVKSADLIAKAADKQLSIIQQGVDRLRNAFASKTGFSLADSFKDGGSADKLLSDLKAKLLGAKELQANAAALAGMGYSQVFIEEVVKNGPEAGNAIATALKAASPAATAELQQLYNAVEDISANGLNALASQMSTSTSFATEALLNAYNQVSIDLKQSLATVNSELQMSLAAANTAYSAAVTEAKSLRDEKMLEADAQLKEAIADSKAALDESLADAQKTLLKAQGEAQKNLSEGLAEIQKTLQKALLDAQKDYEKAIDEINKSTMKKLQDLKDNLTEVAKQMAALGAAKAAATALAKTPVYVPIVKMPTAPPVTPIGSGTDLTSLPKGGSADAAYDRKTINNIAITGVNLADPEFMSTKLVNAIKYGQAVTVSTDRNDLLERLARARIATR